MPGSNWVTPLVATGSVPLGVPQLTKATVDTITTEILIRTVCLLSANDRENVPMRFLAMRLPAASIMPEHGTQAARHPAAAILPKPRRNNGFESAHEVLVRVVSLQPRYQHKSTETR
jgi:hypothetical protein